MNEKAGKHRAPGRHHVVVDWAARRHHHFLVIGHCLGEIGLGGASIVLFEWLRPTLVGSSHTQAIVELVRNVQL